MPLDQRCRHKVRRVATGTTSTDPFRWQSTRSPLMAGMLAIAHQRSLEVRDGIAAVRAEPHGAITSLDLKAGRVDVQANR
jgi:hypothetical protein